MLTVYKGHFWSDGERVLRLCAGAELEGYCTAWTWGKRGAWIQC